jgi:hypothetical protein
LAAGFASIDTLLTIALMLVIEVVRKAFTRARVLVPLSALDAVCCAVLTDTGLVTCVVICTALLTELVHAVATVGGLDTLAITVTVDAFAVDFSLFCFADVVWQRINVKGRLSMVIDTEFVDESLKPTTSNVMAVVWSINDWCCKSRLIGSLGPINEEFYRLKINRHSEMVP